LLMARAAAPMLSGLRVRTRTMRRLARLAFGTVTSYVVWGKIHHRGAEVQRQKEEEDRRKEEERGKERKKERGLDLRNLG